MRIACRPILALAFTLPLLAQSGPPRAIYADFTRIRGRMSQVFKECIAAGRANEGLRADWQVFYKKDLPAKDARAVRLEIAQLPAGRYLVEAYRTGYRMNDPYTAYLDMGAPAQLTRPQEDALRQAADGSPAMRAIVSHAGGTYSKEFAMRENDVVLVLVRKL